MADSEDTQSPNYPLGVLALAVPIGAVGFAVFIVAVAIGDGVVGAALVRAIAVGALSGALVAGGVVALDRLPFGARFRRFGPPPPLRDWSSSFAPLSATGGTSLSA